MSRADKLKEIAAAKKKLNEEQKAIRDEMDESKVERIAARKVQSECRKDLITGKADQRELSAKIYPMFSKGSAEELNKLADEIVEVAAELATTVRNFAKATETLDEL